MMSDFYTILGKVEEQKESLLNAWISREHQDFERIIRLAIQGIESEKNRNPELNISIQYQLGKLDGYTELLEQLYRKEQKEKKKLA